jgi:hypothetical protein
MTITWPLVLLDAPSWIIATRQNGCNETHAQRHLTHSPRSNREVSLALRDPQNIAAASRTGRPSEALAQDLALFLVGTLGLTVYPNRC